MPVLVDFYQTIIINNLAHIIIVKYIIHDPTITKILKFYNEIGIIKFSLQYIIILSIQNIYKQLMCCVSFISGIVSTISSVWLIVIFNFYIYF